MRFDILQYNKMLVDSHISIIYSGPIWAENLDDFSEMVRHRLGLGDLSLGSSQAVFSVFVEQMNNLMMYSAEKERFAGQGGGLQAISKGIFVLGVQDQAYFIQSGNVIKSSSVEALKSRIDYLNGLDKKELRQYYKQQMKAENDNSESKGGGLGLIEIARRAASKIEYEFTPHGDGLSYFVMYVTISPGGGK